MTEHQNGLRFDIYERLHLDESATAIRELDEMELIPHIQVVQEDEQAVLKGNLWLTGKYTGENGEESRTLEHFIPVEITLPMNRIQRLEDISVDIDNFDVDLLSARSVNVTGVLSLHGIEMISRIEESWKEEEEFVVVHQAGEPAPYLSEQVRGETEGESEQNAAEPNSASGYEESEKFGDISIHLQSRSSEPAAESLHRHFEPSNAKEEESNGSRSSVPVQDPFQINEHGSWDKPAQAAEASEEAAREQTETETETEDEDNFSTQEATLETEGAARVQEKVRETEETVNVQAAESNAAVEIFRKESNEKTEELQTQTQQKEEKSEQIGQEKADEEEANEEETIEVVMPPDKQEMKIAFKSAEPSSSYHLKNLLQKVDVTDDVAEHRAPEEPEVQELEPESEQVEFRRLVTRREEGNEQQFKRMRMCIVQKEETLDTIAERYNMNPREIILYNRLGDQQVQEGQVIYIP